MWTSCIVQTLTQGPFLVRYCPKISVFVEYIVLKLLGPIIASTALKVNKYRKQSLKFSILPKNEQKTKKIYGKNNLFLFFIWTRNCDEQGSSAINKYKRISNTRGIFGLILSKKSFHNI